MNELLDLGELALQNKKQEGWKVDIFDDVLKRVHELIKGYNKVRIREMRYKVPHMLMGKPRYEVDKLREYLIRHLTDNGLLVETLDRNLLYISWKEEDINIEKYLNRKTITHNRGSTVYNVPGPEIKLSTQHLESEISLLRSRQAQQRALRAQRFANQQSTRDERFARQQANRDERSSRLQLMEEARQTRMSRLGGGERISYGYPVVAQSGLYNDRQPTFKS